jgi:hypothetical protein
MTTWFMDQGDYKKNNISQINLGFSKKKLTFSVDKL